jgi:hypothetical protein
VREDAAQADLAFPMREQGYLAAESLAASRDAAHAMVRHAFASWFARLLCGYQRHLRLECSATSPLGAISGNVHGGHSYIGRRALLHRAARTFTHDLTRVRSTRFCMRRGYWPRATRGSAPCCARCCKYVELTVDIVSRRG